jgi:small subunit ribosomal protein S21
MEKLTGRLVIVSDNNIEKALRKFKKKIATSGILNDLREKEHYVKPKTRRKLKKSAAANRWRRYVDSQELPTRQF